MILKWLYRVLCVIIGTIIILVALVYLPPVQRVIFSKAITIVSKSTGWDISAEDINLKFPLKLNARDVLILDKGDTAIYVGKFYANVKPMPLFALNVALDSASADCVIYNMESVDSLMNLGAEVGKFSLSQASVGLGTHKISLDKVNISGGDIHLNILGSSEPEPDSVSVEPVDWNISANCIELDSISYMMQMLPAIDTLDASIRYAKLLDGNVDLGSRTVNADSLLIMGVAVKYLLPFTATSDISEHREDIISTDSIATDSALWRINANGLRLSQGSAIYAMSKVVPQPGFDMNYIEVDSVEIAVDNFYNCGSAITVPLKGLHAMERSGISISNAFGTFSMTDTTIIADDIHVNTANSQLSVNANIESGVFQQCKDSRIDVDISSVISTDDVILAYPNLPGQMIKSLHNSSISIIADLNGSLSNLIVENIEVSVPKAIDIGLKGHMANILDNNTRYGNITIAGHTANLNRFRTLFLDKSVASQYNLLATTMKSDISINGQSYAGNVDLKAVDGLLALSGKVDIAKQTYNVAVNASKLPIDKVMQESKIGKVSATMVVDGQKFNPVDSSAVADLKIDITSLPYNGFDYRNILVGATLSGGNLTADFSSDNIPLSFNSTIKSSLLNDRYDYTADVDVENIDLHDMGVVADSMTVKGNLTASGVIDLRKSLYSSVLDLDDFVWKSDNSILKASGLEINLKSDSITSVSVTDGDLRILAVSPCNLDSILSMTSHIGDSLNSYVAQRTFNFERIQPIIPTFNIRASMKNNNIVADFLKLDKITFSDASFDLVNDTSIRANAYLNKLKITNTTLDTIRFKAAQHGEGLYYAIDVANQPGNLDQFAQTEVYGKIEDNRADLMLHQKNRKGLTGFDFGLAALISPEAIKVNILPEHPVIGYREWTINKDNFVEYYPESKHIDANLNLYSDAGYMTLKTIHKSDSTQEDIVLKAGGINLAEWLNVSPLMPQVGGVLSADANLSSMGKNLNGDASLGLSNLIYNKKQIGSIDFDVNLSSDSAMGGNVATAVMKIDGRNTISARGLFGASSDSLGGMDYSVSINRFPLSIVNPFIPQNMVELHGFLSGDASMRGSSDAPILNGSLHCDSTLLKLPLFGSRLSFSDNPIQLIDNNILFDNFQIIGINGNPISINGNVNLMPVSSPKIDLKIAGENVQVVESKYTSKSQVFGKAYIDLNANAAGRMSKLDVNAFLNILPKTNVTYVMQDNVEGLSQSKNSEMVRFVNFNDTTQVDDDEEAPNEQFNMNLDAIVNVQQGSTINVNLSPDGKNKVQLMGQGTLTYSMDGSTDGRLSGRYTIDNGFVRYYPPFISEKYFTFTPGSYVAFNGDMMNPTLSIKAVGNQATTVLTDGSNPMRVNFQITASVTNTLNDMKVDFDLAAPNNSIVETELQSQTQAQRSAQAINLMLYGTYSSGQTSTASATNANMLYSLLSSQLNNLASKVVKGVDISFGINQYNMSNNGNPSTGMNYSYSVSKSLFDDRFKMTVGGNYDTNESNDMSVAQNLFSNISFEYRLNQSGTMALQLYNKVTDNNIYQTQVNETGLAFTLRRKISNLLDVFRSVKSKIMGNRSSADNSGTPAKEANDHEKKLDN